VNFPTRARIVSAIAALAMLLTALVAAPAQAAVATPSGLRVVSTSSSAVALSWKASPGAPRYRIQYSTSSSMSKANYVRFTGTSGEITGLTAGKTYYFKVRAITSSGANLSKYSAAVKAKTAAHSGYRWLSPSGLSVTGSSASSLALTWAPRGDSGRYRISWSTDSGFRNPGYVRVTGTGYTLSGLAAGTTYYLKVRVIDSAGTNLSAYSWAVSATTAKNAGSPATSGGSQPAPGSLTVTATARSSVALAWAAVPGAPGYRVQYSTSSSMSKASYRRITTNSAELSGLSSGKRYYFKVRVIRTDGTNLSPYSAAASATTLTSIAASYLPPASVQVSPSGATKIAAGWKSRGSGLTYQLDYSESASFSAAQSVFTTGTTTTLTGLAEKTTYHVRLRVVAAAKTNSSALSSFSAPASTTTTAAPASTLRVGSYNIKCANCYSALPNEGTWYQRRDAVVKNILAQKLDVLGLQEASQGWLKDANGKPVSLSQFEDLTKRLGSPYKLTNTNRNNCVKSSTPTNCAYRDQGASQGTKIVYNSATLSLVDQGSKLLSRVGTTGGDRYVAWAVFEQKATGKRFFFADTHLESKADASGSSTYFTLRVQQTREILEVVKASGRGLPTYVVGDFNSHKWTVPANGPYDTMRAAGFIDPIGNAYRTTKTTPGAIVEKRIRTNFSSYNGYARKAPSFSYINGTYLDYIWVSPKIEVPEWETVVDVDSSGDFVGVIPSDHNLVRATTTLP